MKLQEKHKEFAVKCYARFLTRTEVVSAFMEEFKGDLPPPPECPELSEEECQEVLNYESPDETLHRDKFIFSKLKEYETKYEEVYGADAAEKFEAARETLAAEAKQTWYGTTNTIEAVREGHYIEHQVAVENHYKYIRREISSQLRRLHIAHRQFPEKYRALFNEAREQYFNDHRGESLGISENVLKELEILLGYVKQCIFNEENGKEAMQFITLGHQILKTVVAHNAVSGKQELLDITPQGIKALTDSQHVLTDQLKTVTEQLAEHTGTPSNKEDPVP